MCHAAVGMVWDAILHVAESGVSTPLRTRWKQSIDHLVKKEVFATFDSRTEFVEIFIKIFDLASTAFSILKEMFLVLHLFQFMHEAISKAHGRHSFKIRLEISFGFETTSNRNSNDIQVGV